MMPAVHASDVERFRGIVAAQFGLQFDDGRLEFLAGVLRKRLAAEQVESGHYLARLECLANETDSSALAQELTVGETYFFRNREQFAALAERLLPERLEARASERRLDVLSAGCASGEEAYTLAIVLHEAVPADWTVSIRAVDINETALGKARSAHYSPWALRETGPAARDRWFRPVGRDFVLADEIVRSVSFERRNLATDDPELWKPDHYDVVFCRNVLMYFAPDQMRRAIGRIAGSIAPGGYFFLGHAETLRGLSEDFHLRHSHDTFYYQRRGAGVQGSSLPASRSSERPQGPTPVPPVSTHWFEQIGRSTDRIRDLQAQPGPNGHVVSAERSEPNLMARGLALMQADKPGDALTLVETISAEGPAERDLLLVAAALLVQMGRTLAAAEVADRLLNADEMCAGAHYVLALCSDSAGNRVEAARHDGVATYLDPDFAMPRLHMGLLARRAGDPDAARRELGHALLLLRREDPARLLLFGGGFGREGLVAMCQSELDAIRWRR